MAPTLEQIIKAMDDSLRTILGGPWRQADSGWGILPDGSAPSDLWSTAEILILIRFLDKIGYNLPIGSKINFRSALDASDNWIISHQNPDGGWSHKDISNASGTALAIWALSASDNERDRARKYQDEINDGVKWLKEHRSLDEGGWSLEGPSTTYDTSIVALMTQKLPETLRADPDVNIYLLQHARDFLFDSQNPDDGWGNTQESRLSDPQNTALAAYTLFNLTEDEFFTQHAEKGLDWLRSFHQKNRAWTEIEATAWALNAFISGGVNVNNPYVQSAVKFILSTQNKKDNGWGFKQGSESTTFHTFYALYALGHYWKASQAPQPSWIEKVGHFVMRTLSDPVTRTILLFLVATIGIVLIVSSLTGQKGDEQSANLTALGIVISSISVLTMLALAIRR